MYLAKPSFSLRAESSSTPTRTSTPPARSLAMPSRTPPDWGRWSPHDPCHACATSASRRVRFVRGGCRARGHIGGRPAGQPACLLEGNNLGVVPLVELMEAFGHQNIVPSAPVWTSTQPTAGLGDARRRIAQPAAEHAPSTVGQFAGRVAAWRSVAEQGIDESLAIERQ